VWCRENTSSKYYLRVEPVRQADTSLPVLWDNGPRNARSREWAILLLIIPGVGQRRHNKTSERTAQTSCIAQARSRLMFARVTSPSLEFPALLGVNDPEDGSLAKVSLNEFS
jgi:hypothetical protein